MQILIILSIYFLSSFNTFAQQEPTPDLFAPPPREEQDKTLLKEKPKTVKLKDLQKKKNQKKTKSK